MNAKPLPVSTSPSADWRTLDQAGRRIVQDHRVVWRAHGSLLAPGCSADDFAHRLDCQSEPWHG